MAPHSGVAVTAWRVASESAAAAASMVMPLCLPPRPMVVGGVLCVTFSFRTRVRRKVARCHQVAELASATAAPGTAVVAAGLPSIRYPIVVDGSSGVRCEVEAELVLAGVCS